MAYDPKPEFNDFVRNTFYKGWTDEGAMRGNWRDTGEEAWLNYQRANDPAYQAQQKAEQYTQQAIQTLQGQQPKIGEIYKGKQEYLQSQLDPTKARYDALLADIKAREQTSTEEQTKATQALLARRGIASDVGRGAQELIDTTQPIRRQYGGLYTQTGLQQEEAIKAINDAIKLLGGEQTQQEMNLASLIAQAMQGGASTALSSGSLLMSQAQQQAQNRINELLAKQQASQSDIENQIALAQLALQQERSPYELALLQAQAARAGQLASGGGGSGAVTSIEDLWGF